ncbi:MAG: hypothetical protein AABZ32_08705 [Bacteroidota bacterium]
MELEVLKKKLSAFKGDGGRIRSVSDDLLLEVLAAWEQWGGSSKDFYKGIGSSKTGICGILGKAKRLKRAGGTMPFLEVAVDGVTDTDNPTPIICDIELSEKNVSIQRDFLNI